MNTRQASSKQEKRVAKTLGEKVVAGSGAMDFLKGDVFGSLFIECKTNMEKRKTITVKEDWFLKAKAQAYQMRRNEYVVSFSFDNETDYFATESTLFQEMYKSYKAVQTFIEEYGLDDELDFLGDNEGIKARNEIRNLIKEII